MRREEERGKERKGKKIVHAGFFICKGERKDGKGGSGKKLPRGEEREDIRKQRGKNAPNKDQNAFFFFFFFFFLVQCDFNSKNADVSFFGCLFFFEAGGFEEPETKINQSSTSF